MLVHYHIPRTGGTTLVGILKRQYGSGATVELARTQPLSAMRRLVTRRDGMSDVQVVSTSHPFGVSRLVRADRNITMLRSPVPRVCSYFDLVRRTPGVVNGRWQELHLMANRMTLAQYLRDSGDPEVNDWQVRILSGCGALPGIGEVTAGQLDAARTNLETAFDAVGTTERYDDSVALFARVLGWPGVRMEVLNASPAADVAARRTLPPATLDLVREMNQLDEQLYRSAATQLENRLAPAA